MAFADYAARRDNAYGYYVLISGIPYVFADFPCPAAWEVSPGSGTVTIDGEVYTWSQTFEADKRSNSQKVQVKDAIGTSGKTKLRFRLRGTTSRITDLWSGLITSALRVEGHGLCILDEALDADETGAALVQPDTTSWPAGSSTVYAGLETFTFASKTSSQFTTLTRGAYGSQAKFHPNQQSYSSARGPGEFLASRPLVWEGRIAKVWFALGKVDGDNAFEPHASSPCSDDDLREWSGVVVSATEAKDKLHIVMETIGLTRLLQREVASRLPTGHAGVPLIYDSGAIVSPYIAADADLVEFTWLHSGSSGGELVSMRLTDGSFYPGEVEGYYTMAQVASYLQYVTYPSTWGDYGVSMWVNSDRQYVVKIYVDGSTSYQDWGLTINATSTHSFWRSLGFEGIVQAEHNYDGSYSEWVLTAQRRFPLLYLPPNETGRKIHVQREIGSPEFTTSHGWTTDGGGAIPAYIKIDEEEIVEVDTIADSGYVRGHWLTVSARGQLGSRMHEIYVEAADERDQDAGEMVTATQGIACPGCSLWRMLLYAMLSGSGAGTNDPAYDQGWTGSGANIDGSLVNVDELEGLAVFDPLPRDRMAVFHQAKLVDLFRHELILSSAAIAEIGGQLTARVYTPPLEGVASAYDFDDDNTIRGSVVDQSTDKIINHIHVKCDYDHASGEFFHDIDSIQATSKATWGAKPILELEIKSIGGSLAQQIVRDLSDRIFSAFAFPYAIVEVESSRIDSWAVDLVSPVTITDPEMLPLPVAGAEVVNERGVTSLPGQLMAMTRQHPDPQRSGAADSRGKATIVVGGIDGQRRVTWAPSARVTSSGSATLSCDAHAYSASSEAVDVSHFDPGDYVRVYVPGNESASVLRTVVSVDTGASTITLDSAVYYPAPTIIEGADYDSASLQDSQRRHAYMSDGDGVLDKSTGDDAAEVWV